MAAAVAEVGAEAAPEIEAVGSKVVSEAEGLGSKVLGWFGRRGTQAAVASTEAASVETAATEAAVSETAIASEAAVSESEVASEATEEATAAPSSGVIGRLMDVGTGVVIGQSLTKEKTAPTQQPTLQPAPPPPLKSPAPQPQKLQTVGSGEYRYFLGGLVVSSWKFWLQTAVVVVLLIIMVAAITYSSETRYMYFITLGIASVAGAVAGNLIARGWH